jgi:hypothetical protein
MLTAPVLWQAQAAQTCCNVGAAQVASAQFSARSIAIRTRLLATSSGSIRNAIPLAAARATAVIITDQPAAD